MRPLDPGAVCGVSVGGGGGMRLGALRVSAHRRQSGCCGGWGGGGSVTVAAAAAAVRDAPEHGPQAGARGTSVGRLLVLGAARCELYDWRGRVGWCATGRRLLTELLMNATCRWLPPPPPTPCDSLSFLVSLTCTPPHPTSPPSTLSQKVQMDTLDNILSAARPASLPPGGCRGPRRAPLPPAPTPLTHPAGRAAARAAAAGDEQPQGVRWAVGAAGGG